MKNKHNELLRKMQREYHSHHQWDLDSNGLYIRHLYSDKQPTENDLSWWDDFGFIHGGRRIMIWWEHPRMEYSDEIDRLSNEEAGELPKNALFANKKKKYKKVGKSRKSIVSYECNPFSEEYDKHLDRYMSLVKQKQMFGIDFEVRTSYQVEHLTWALGINLIVPMEVRNVQEAKVVADLVKRILKRETTIEKEFPNYRYGKNDWLKEQQKIQKCGLLHEHKIA